MEKPLTKLVIPIHDIVNFCFCPLYYKIKKNFTRKNMKDKYTMDILWCIYQYMNRFSNLNTSGIAFLKKCWGIRWIEDKTVKKIATVASSVKRDTYNTKRVNGLDALINFHNLIDGNESHCIMSGKSFEVEILPGIFVSGTWDLIQEVNDGAGIKIIKIIPESNKFEIKHSIRYNIEVTLMYYAFITMFDSLDKEVSISVYDLQKNKEWPTERTEDDIKILKNTVETMIYCVNHNIMLLSPDKKCYHCDVRHLCEKSIYDDGKLKKLRRKNYE